MGYFILGFSIGRHFPFEGDPSRWEADADFICTALWSGETTPKSKVRIIRTNNPKAKMVLLEGNHEFQFFTDTPTTYKFIRLMDFQPTMF